MVQDYSIGRWDFEHKERRTQGEYCRVMNWQSNGILPVKNTQNAKTAGFKCGRRPSLLGSFRSARQWDKITRMGTGRFTEANEDNVHSAAQGGRNAFVLTQGTSAWTAFSRSGKLFCVNTQD